MARPTSEFEIFEKFRTVETEVKQTLSKITSPLKLGLCVLTLAQDRFGVEYLSLNEIIESLDRLGVAVNRIRLVRALAGAGNRIRRVEVKGVTKYKVMTVGRQGVEDIISITGPQVVYMEGDKPRTARKKLKDIIATMRGTIRICDPYYGVRTLDILELFPSRCDIRFLTAKTTEKSAKIKSAISDFKKEYPKVEIRIYPRDRELHDRYVIAGNRLLIIGHGIKDIGNKESFIIQVDSTYAGDLIRMLLNIFDQRWSSSSPLSG